MRAQLEFLSAQLHRLNEFNTAPMLHHLREAVRKLLKEILSDFILIDVVRTQDPFTISVDRLDIRLPLDRAYMGILNYRSS